MSEDLKELLSREAQRVRPAPAPIDAVLADVQTRVRRRRLVTTAVAAALAVLAAAGPWVVGRLGESSTVGQPVTVVPSDPVWGPYRVGDTIYLGGDVTASNKRLADQMARVPDGVVYSTDTGKVVLFTRDGVERQIGDHADTHSGPIQQRFPALASDSNSGWVAWMEEPAGKDYGDIVVYDTTAGTHGEEVNRLRVGFDGPRDCGAARSASYGPFAVDDSAVYYCTAEGDFVWRPTSRDPEPEQILPVAGDPTTSDDYLLDVRNGVRVVLRDTSEPRPVTVADKVGQPGTPVVIDRSLIDGFLSRDGRYLAGLREPRMSVYDTATGHRLPIDSSDAGPLALAMTFTDNGGVAYAVTDSPEHTNRWAIVVCDLPKSPCRTVSGDLDGGVFFVNQRIQ